MLLQLLGSRSHCLNCRSPTLKLPLQRFVNIWTKQRPTNRNGLLLASKNFVCVRKETRRWLNSVDTKRAAKSLRGTTWKDLKEIFALAAPYKGRLCLGLSMLGISSSIYLLVPRILGKLIDEFDERKLKTDEVKKEDSATRLARYFKDNPAAMLGVLFIGACAISARIYFMHTAGQLIINNLRTKVFSAVMRQDMAFFDKNKVGEMVSRLSTDALIVGYAVSMNLSEGARALVTFLGSGALMVYTSLAMTKVVLFVIPIILGTFYVFGRLQRRYTQMMQEAVAGANQRFSNVRTVRMLVAEKKEEASYAERMMEIWRISKMEGIARGAMFGGFQFTGYFAMTVVLYYGSSMIGQGLLSYGDLSSFCLYAVFCASSLGNLSNFYTELMKGLGASSRLFELKNRVPAIPLTGGIKAEHLLGEIRFDSVAFAYPNREDAPIFTDLKLRIPAGKITAVVGPSGSGKSSLAHLILRLYDPDQGRITVDGVDLKEYDPSWWRRQVGTVSQEPVLFSTTIWNNIAYAAEKPELVENWRVQQAAAQSNSLEFIREFPDGFQTLVGEHGSSMLSGGQKQRIAIARALIMNPRILVMDEATSALDATSEYLVRQALSKLLINSHQTVLIIAHRLSTIKHADQIAVLDKGTIVELGTFEDLMRIDDGVFKKLVEKQTIGWREESY